MARERLQSDSVVSHGLESTYSISELCDQFIRYGYEVAQHSPQTMRTRKNHLGFFVDYCRLRGLDDIRALNNPIIDDYFVEYSKTRAKSTTNTGRRILKVFIRWVDGYKETSLRAKPESIRLVKARKTNPEAIDDTYTSKVLSECENEQDRLIIATLRESGVRAGELVGIRVRDVLRDQICVTTGKDEFDRNVFITPQLASTLLRFAEENERTGSDWLFQNVYAGYGDQMKVKTINIRIQKCYERITGVRVHTHQLRHTMAIAMLRGGADLVSIQRQLGHKDITTTQTYLRVDDSFVRESYAKSMPNSILGH